MSMFDQLLHSVPCMARVLTVLTGAIAAIAGMMNIFFPHQYTVFAVSLWTTLAGVATVSCETSPDGNLLMLKMFPFFEFYQSRGIAYAAIGLLTLGREFGPLARISGCFFMASGMMHVALDYLSAHGHAANGISPNGTGSNRVTFHPISTGYRNLSSAMNHEEFQHMNAEGQSEASYPEV